MSTYHVYLNADLHVEVDAATPAEADKLALEKIEKEIALAVASAPSVVVIDVCDEQFRSIDY